LFGGHWVREIRGDALAQSSRGTPASVASCQLDNLAGEGWLPA
jgi:hypothetical protein